MRKIDIEEVKEYIRNTSNSTKIYIGADSERYKKNGVWFADYTVAIVIHIDGNHGCKVFGTVDTERDYDQKKNRPRTRLMNEVYRASQMYLELAEAIGDRHAEVHLDISCDVMNGSSCVMNEAIGYVKGMCNITPKLKPDAFSASYTADRLKDILSAAA